MDPGGGWLDGGGLSGGIERNRSGIDLYWPHWRARGEFEIVTSNFLARGRIPFFKIYFLFHCTRFIKLFRIFAISFLLRI